MYEKVCIYAREGHSLTAPSPFSPLPQNNTHKAERRRFDAVHHRNRHSPLPLRVVAKVAEPAGVVLAGEEEEEALVEGEGRGELTLDL